MSELSFSNLNPYGGLQFLVGNSPEQLVEQLAQIKTPIKIISMYAMGQNHIVWFLADVKINKVKKGNKNGNSSGI